MRKVLLSLILLSLPLVSYAKHCSTCFATFQMQTVRGQSKLFYRWLVNVLSRRNQLDYQDVKRLFGKDISVIANGHRVAQGRQATYQYLAQWLRQQQTIESRLNLLLTDRDHSAISYQMVVNQQSGNYRVFTMVILDFHKGQIVRWYSISHKRVIG